MAQKPMLRGEVANHNATVDCMSMLLARGKIHRGVKKLRKKWKQPNLLLDRATPHNAKITKVTLDRVGLFKKACQVEGN